MELSPLFAAEDYTLTPHDLKKSRRASARSNTRSLFACDILQPLNPRRLRREMVSVIFVGQR